MVQQSAQGGLERLIGEAGGAEHVAVMRDVTTGFCSRGAVSPRVAPSSRFVGCTSWPTAGGAPLCHARTRTTHAVEFGTTRPTGGARRVADRVELRSLPSPPVHDLLKRTR